MNARRLIFCLLLSVMLTATFIPMIAFGEAGDSHEIIVCDDEGDSVAPEFYEDEEEDYWAIPVDGGMIYSPAIDDNGLFAAVEGEEVEFFAVADGGYYPGDASVCVMDADEEYVDELEVSSGDEGCYSFIMPTDQEYPDYSYIRINVPFYYDDDDFESKFTDFDEIVDSAQAISVGQTKAVDTEGIFKFKPTVSGNYAFYSYTTSDPDADPIGRVLDEDGVSIQASDDYNSDNPHFKVCFYAEAGETYYLQAATYTGTGIFGVKLEKDILVKSVSFSPNGTHLATISCEVSLDDETIWNNLKFAVGDKIKVTYENNSTKDFVYKMKPDPWDPGEMIGIFVNPSNENEVLPGNASLEFINGLSVANYKPGQTANALATFCFEDAYHSLDEDDEYGEDNRITQNALISVKFAISHMDGYMIKTAAVPSTCTTSGNIEFWYCMNCDKYFSDKDGLKEITVNGAVVPAGHKWKHVTVAAGLLKNGIQYDQCTGCGAKQNSSVIPGWAKYYVKSPKAVAGKKSFTVKWGKQSKANLKKFNGYQIRYSTKKNMTKAKMAKAGKTAKLKKVGGLKSKTRYFVQVRTFTKKGGVTYYSKWSPKKTVKTR